MNRKLGISFATCILALCLHAETIRVLRFVPVAGAETEVAQNTLRKFLEWKKIGMPAVLPMSMVTLNELYDLGIKDNEAFLEPLASNMKSWIISKKFSLSEFTQLLGTDSIAKFMQPAYCDSTTVQMQRVLSYVDRMRFTGDWTPDADTDIKLYHSLNDDIVAPENSQRMYEWLVNHGVQNATLDTSSLTGTHLSSATYFLLNVITYDLTGW